MKLEISTEVLRLPFREPFRIARHENDGEATTVIVTLRSDDAEGIGTALRLNSSAASSRTDRVRPMIATRAPSCARQRAVANPMPRPPPTTQPTPLSLRTTVLTWAGESTSR